MITLTDRRSDAALSLDNQDYFSEIERAFVRRRGRNLLLSPVDWSLLEDWEKRGIPLKIVLATIEEVFDQLDADPGRARSVRTLSYCKDAVESRYRTWREGRVGSDPADAPEYAEPDPSRPVEAGMKEHLSALVSELELVSVTGPAAAELVGPVRKELEKISGLGDDTKIEKRLEELDERVDGELLEALSDGELREQRTIAEGRLAAGRSSMDPESFDRARDLLVRKAVREASGIPRFGLYQL